MNLIKQSVGVDISMDKFDACFSVMSSDQTIKIKGTKKFKQTLKGFEEFLSWIEKRRLPNIPLVVAMEATGVYHEELAWFLFDKDIDLSVLLPIKVKRFMGSTVYKTKTDKVDSKGLAQFGLERKMELWHPLSKNIYGLRQLTRELDILNQERTMNKNRLHAHKYSHQTVKEYNKRLEKRLKFIENQIKSCKADIEKLISKDEKLKSKTEKMMSIPGVGLITTATVIAETDGFSHITKQGQLVSYSGLDVVKKDSGQVQSRGWISKKGNKRLRKALFMSGFSVVTHSVPVFKNLFLRLVKKGKTKMQAYVAVQKKILITLWALWCTDKEFDPTYYQTAKAH